ncbi:hypothetical protein ASPZODRAFT_127500 [Penicilliopsis zonata CBS 506.65]|uniref:RRM domain-containing protein n=1 Tax=Penicilliopsis zonata CBS 506.65 TaxID=1073090 RepID=A0A1L9SW63_9EURO|nr:hypothetical protein ASPZODRAFT_127500 [Penicilliopsis zonata CBS 506.65]OJJ51428.1 hypothetical protein ASPZODRAFT_127500 [Penicilliopsis zonata CBS 506.65]
MTPSPPDEALHFRGKTLTPESPRPLHVAEPTNIPVLFNQMDPVLNDTAHYKQSESDHGSHMSSDPSSQLAQDISNDPSQPPSVFVSSLPFFPTVPVTATADEPRLDLDLPFKTQHRHSESQNPRNPAAAGEEGVDFQNLLDNLPPSSSSTAAPVLVKNAHQAAEDPALTPAAEESVHTPLGLPPRPPPQNNYPSDDFHPYHPLPAPSSTTNAPPYPSQQSNYPLATTGAPGTSSGSSSLPPPPVATFQQQPQQQQQPVPAPAAGAPESPKQANTRSIRVERLAGRQYKPGDDDAPWGPEVQKKYDEFLHDERIYVTEGLWDRFPPGSRLFVGNLPTERVTKRDLFHIFHEFGKLAQISIKQAYGFIQFLDASACHQALLAEQGVVVRGRKIHLEISKPQRNTKPGAPPSADPVKPRRSRSPPPKRSRSPEYLRNGHGTRGRGQGDRFDRPYEAGRAPFGNFRDDPASRRRDEYRPPRSPSPRGFRGREDYWPRDRSPERFDRRDRDGRRRSRSPYGRDRRYRSPSPRPRSGYEGDADLPVPRRAPRDVPDVQILVLEEIDRNFLLHVESAFRNRGLRVDTLTLGPRIPLAAALHRQIVEGVPAIVKLSRSHQYSSKIFLQTFDRSGGADNVRSNDYPDIDANAAADFVLRAQAMQRSGVPVSYPSNLPFTMPAFPPTQAAQPVSMPSSLPQPPNIANLIGSLDGPALHSLLGALQQQQQRANPMPTAQPSLPTTNSIPGADLANLLSNAARQTTQIPPVLASGQQQPVLHPLPQFPMQAPSAPMISDPNLISLLAKGLGGQQPQQNQGTNPDIHNIMHQLAKWKQ